MESLERFVMLATSNDITRAAVDHGHVSCWCSCSVVVAICALVARAVLVLALICCGQCVCAATGCGRRS